MVLSGYKLPNQQKLPNGNPAERYALCWLSPKSLRGKLSDIKKTPNANKKPQAPKPNQTPPPQNPNNNNNPQHLLFETECVVHGCMILPYAGLQEQGEK